MLHNRIATQLQEHLSPAGPSPLASSQVAAFPATTLPATNPTPRPILPSSTPEPSGPRLVSPSLTVLPPAPPPTPTREPFLPELLATAAHRSAAFFAEAAVLVLVLGLLDRLLSRGHLELPWVLGTLVTTLVLLFASILTDVSARRWLRTH